MLVRPEYLHSDITAEIILAVKSTFNYFGYGLPEVLWRRSLALQLDDRGIPVEEEVTFPVHFKGRPVGFLRADLVVRKVVIVEVKAQAKIETRDVAQTMSYLRASELEVGLVVNFGLSPTVKRVELPSRRRRAEGRSIVELVPLVEEVDLRDTGTER